jgi:S-adenosylmethionine hydrolase
MQAPLITLTTDLGIKDFYVPAVKGYLLNRLPAANIIDITHQVNPFDIAEASFIFRGCYREFPAGTCHLISVDANYDSEDRFILVKSAEQYFLVRDNGFMALVLEDQPAESIIEIPHLPEDLVFPLRYILAPTAVQLWNGTSPEALGNPLKNFTLKGNIRPAIEEDFIRGSVIYVDNLGNAISNISRESFMDHARGRKFRIYIGRKEYFDSICLHSNEVPEGEKLCLFGPSGYLEFAINKGNASQLLGLYPGHNILIEFS